MCQRRHDTMFTFGGPNEFTLEGFCLLHSRRTSREKRSDFCSSPSTPILGCGKCSRPLPVSLRAPQEIEMQKSEEATPRKMQHVGHFGLRPSYGAHLGHFPSKANLSAPMPVSLKPREIEKQSLSRAGPQKSLKKPRLERRGKLSVGL